MSGHRIMFVTPDLSGGGAARVACILSNEWVRAGHEVHMVTYDVKHAVPFYFLDEKVIRHDIDLHASKGSVIDFILNNIKRVISVRRKVKSINPSVVVSFLMEANMASVLAGSGLKVPVFISERNHPASYKLSSLNSFLRRLIYPRATKLCVQTEDISNWFRKNLSIEAAVIPNPVPVRRDLDRDGMGDVSQPQHRRRAISLGRLEPQKGYDLLIEAFAGLAESMPEWDIVVYGEGGQRSDLEKRVIELGLEGRIQFLGVTTAPAETLRSADLYIHPARYEGFPNALMEALAARLCVVATDCPGATGEVLRDGAGLLVASDDADDLARGMSMVMADDVLRGQYAKRARDAVLDYAPGVIAQRWISEFDQFTGSGSTDISVG